MGQPAPHRRISLNEFPRGSTPYEEAHGLYLSRRGRLRVVSPGEAPPRAGRKWRRLRSVAHPGVAREQAETPAGRYALLHSIPYGISGSGQGCDIAEFQSSTPGGFSFYIERLLNENNREDTRWRMHKANIDAMGAPAGPYGIVRPGGDAVAWAHHFADLIAQTSWAFVPTIDSELGDPAANGPYVQTVADVLHQRGHPVVMGYFSTGGSYRRFVEPFVQRRWGACWGCAYPPGFDAQQWSGSPLDRDFCPNFAAISAGGSPAPVPVPHGGDEDMFPKEFNGDTIYHLSGGDIRPLNGDEWALFEWELTVQNGTTPKPVQMDNGVRLVQLCRLYGVPEWKIQAVLGIDLGAPNPPDATDLTPVLDRLSADEAAIAALQTGGPGVDLTPVLDRLDTIDRKLASAAEALV